MATRRASGTGSIFRTTRRGKTVWIARGPGGKPEVWAPTQAEAVRRLAAVRPPGPDVTVGQWADRWEASLQVKPATVRSYKKSLAHVRKHLGTIKVTALTPTRVEQFAADLARAGMHANTVVKTLAELRNMLSGAVRDGILTRNPAALARRPKRVKKDIDPFTAAELAAIVAACDTDALSPVALLAATGCRVGEALALDVCDWDATAGTVAITKTYDRAVGIGPPKSDNSVRTITVPDVARPTLRLAVGRRKAGPLFTSGAGNRRIRELVDQSYRRLLRRLGLRYRKLHALRHSVATMLVASGCGIAEVAAYLGDTPATIYNTYVHPTGVDVSAVIGALLGGG